MSEIIKESVLKVKNKYSTHESYEEHLKHDIEPLKNDVNPYNLRRVGYHLIHIFQDKELSKEIFEHAIEIAESEEDMIDVISDITFLDEEWAKELQETYEVDINN